MKYRHVMTVIVVLGLSPRAASIPLTALKPQVLLHSASVISSPHTLSSRPQLPSPLQRRFAIAFSGKARCVWLKMEN